ncbi:hypothetical protein [Algoriphagus pacificus]|uniref:Tryptophan-rich sensory protein n=1 Tax=Algoriphagus pacificus TaxID=2811234 RepID=A0ABS3CNS0_9BACT|nr:hypothetical protein [Algoriphagus pacificus]MBN7817299.1 hypothetical protein [Algoriphagus pacificus]
MSKLESHIAHIENQIKLNASLKALLVGLGVGILFYAFTESLTVGIACFICAFLIAAYFQGLFRNHKTWAIQILHERIPSLEFSLELLNKKEKNLAEAMQWERINEQIPNEKVNLLGEDIKTFLIFFCISLLAFALSFFSFDFTDSDSETQDLPANTLSESTEVLAVELSDLSVTITPPAYTGLPQRTQESMEIQTIKGSKINWQVQFNNGKELEVKLVNSRAEELDFTKLEDSFQLEDEASGSGIYAIRGYRGEEKVFESSYFTLEAVEDKAPVILPSEKEIYKFHFYKDPSKMPLEAKVSDDFKVSEVFLVATLARGSGENVKFRESKIDIPQKNFQTQTISSELDFEALGFQQGDELYYYWAAKDNKRPEPNFSRSDTYFIKYVDSTGLAEAELAGMAINILPEYFRSQRQIIIDTEKLIAAKKTMKEQEFNETSNNIGYDQKLLRLRYGQYLGEEFENSAGGGSIEDDSGDILAAYRHDHDEEGELERASALIPVEEEHEHGDPLEATETEDESGLGGLLSAFMHSHDSEEENTFFEESTKGALKMALEQMWQSELYLRLYEPEKALPYEKKALEYLKSVQQKSRVYVKRTGFDPPPIKEEEKRLTGELKDIDQLIQKQQSEMDERIQPLASRVLGLLDKDQLSESEKLTIAELGRLWTERMQYSGVEDWNILLELQQLSSGELEAKGKAQLFESLYPFVVSGKELSASYLQQLELEKAFWRNIK